MGNERGQGSWRQRQPPVAADRVRAGPSYLLVRYEGQTPDHYIVRDLVADDVIEVRKHYPPPLPFPVTRRPHQHGARLLRWSTWALAGALLGGIVGVGIGALVALVALARLAGFGGRVRRWRRRDAGPEDDASWLPAAAAMERQRLRAALGQGFLATLLGAAVLALLLPYLWPHVLPYLR